METKSWTWIDKSTWGRGLWQQESDKCQWEDPQTGMPCLIVRSEFSGALCGYVGVSPGHSFYGIKYNRCAKRQCTESYCDASPRALLSVHGGLTYSDRCWRNAEGHGVCHEPAPGEESEIWWIGFDSAHALDHAPAMAARLAQGSGGVIRRKSTGETYRTLEYIQMECQKLALQLDDSAWKARLETLNCKES